MENDESTETAKNPSGTVGKEPTNLWKPWTYKQRLQVVAKVETVKKNLTAKNLTEKTKRQKKKIVRQGCHNSSYQLLWSLIKKKNKYCKNYVRD